MRRQAGQGNNDVHSVGGSMGSGCGGGDFFYLFLTLFKNYFQI
jgi:hypothetical protein